MISELVATPRKMQPVYIINKIFVSLAQPAKGNRMPISGSLQQMIGLQWFRSVVGDPEHGYYHLDDSVQAFLTTGPLSSGSACCFNRRPPNPQSSPPFCLLIKVICQVHSLVNHHTSTGHLLSCILAEFLFFSFIIFNLTLFEWTESSYTIWWDSFFSLWSLTPWSVSQICALLAVNCHFWQNQHF